MRSVSQIYSEAVAVRNNYLQLTELDSGKSNSKMSILNLITYVVAVCIHTYEAILTLFQTRIVESISSRVNGTPDWYAAMARKFQYNSVTNVGDTLIFNEDTLKIEYETPDTARRIISQSSWEGSRTGQFITLKVCKDNADTGQYNSGVPYSPLSNEELTAFKMFIDSIKFVGAEIYCKSLPGDILTVVADISNPIVYDERYATADQVLESIRKSLIEFVQTKKFNEYIYYQEILDVVKGADNVLDVGNGVEIYIKSYNENTLRYDAPQKITYRTKLKSGYAQVLNEDSSPTVNSTSIKLAPSSNLD